MDFDFSDEQVAVRDLAALIVTRHAPGGLLRLAHRPGYITDYGHALSGLTAAFDLLGDPALIDAAQRIADEAIDRLRADDGGFFTTPAGRADLPRRSREQVDNAYPAGQNALAVGLIRLWNLTGLGRWRAIAEGIFASAAGVAGQAPTAVPTLLSAYGASRAGHLTAVVAGRDDDQRTRELLAACRRSWLPNLAVVPVERCRDRAWNCLEGRTAISEPQALICVGLVCLAPARTADEVAQRLAEAERAAPSVPAS
ncbi:MAG: thioredoxin domain-containing protein [Planctomycetes bacterium]|nr:thioredoxin domain-containing protein [Planctomycetota bacterium]